MQFETKIFSLSASLLVGAMTEQLRSELCSVTKNSCAVQDCSRLAVQNTWCNRCWQLHAADAEGAAAVKWFHSWLLQKQGRPGMLTLV
jgi:hypothetical protein